MRLFTGLALPPNIEAGVERLLGALRPLAPGLAWSPVVNLHITTKFIGEWPGERLDELRDALRGVAGPGPLTIPLRGVGWFPNPHQPRALFAAAGASPELSDLAARIEDALAALGVAREEREYRPHLTLARMRTAAGSAALAPLRQAIAQYGSLDFGVLEAQAFHLYSSRAEPEGSVYAKLAEFPLR